MVDMPVSGSSMKSQAKRALIKNQFTHFDSASNADEKWLKNHDDLIRPYQAITTQKFKKVLT